MARDTHAYVWLYNNSTASSPHAAHIYVNTLIISTATRCFSPPHSCPQGSECSQPWRCRRRCSPAPSTCRPRLRAARCFGCGFACGERRGRVDWAALGGKKQKRHAATVLHASTCAARRSCLVATPPPPPPTHTTHTRTRTLTCLPRPTQTLCRPQPPSAHRTPPWTGGRTAAQGTST